MWRSWSEEWERRKSYLVRCLFDDIPMLSPIQETNEPRSDELSPLSPRPYSPLPDLIIEKEKSYHDEPEEYYQILEKKMLNLYRKLFHDFDYEFISDDSRNEACIFNDTEACYDSDHDVDDHYLIMSRDNFEEENIQSLKDKNYLNTSNDYRISEEVSDDTSKPNDASDSPSSVTNDDEDMETETFTQIRQSRIYKETESPEQHTHEVVITHALVHREALAEDREDINNNILSQHDILSQTYTDERSLILVPSQMRYKCSQQYEALQTDSSDRLVGKQARRAHDLNNARIEVDIEDLSEIETVRRNRTKSTSTGYVPEEPASSVESQHLIVETEKDMSVISSSAPSDGMIADPMKTAEITSEFPVDVHNDHVIQPIENSDNIEKGPTKRIRTDRLISEESPNKRKRYETAAIQTSPFDDVQLSWDDLRSNFFQGTPLIYNLCHCRNHVCM